MKTTIEKRTFYQFNINILKVAAMKNLLIALVLLTVLPGWANGTNPDQPAESQLAYDKICKADAWTGEMTLTIAGSLSNVSNDGSTTWNHHIEYVSSAEGDLNASNTVIGATGGFKMIYGQVNARINCETIDVSGGTSTKSTIIGSSGFQTSAIPVDMFTFDSYKLSVGYGLESGYTIQIAKITIDVNETLYSPNKPSEIFQSSPGRWTIPGAKLTNLPYPASGTTLSGTKIIRELVFGASGDAVEMDVIITWSLEPTYEVTPLDPL